MKRLALLLLLATSSAALADTVTFSITTGATGDPETETTVSNVTLRLPEGAVEQMADAFVAIYSDKPDGVNKFRWLGAKIRAYVVAVTKQAAAEQADAARKAAVQSVDDLDKAVTER